MAQGAITEIDLTSDDLYITNVDMQIEVAPYTGVTRAYGGANNSPAFDRIHSDYRAKIARWLTKHLRPPHLIWLRWYILNILPLPTVKVYDPHHGTYPFAVIDAELQTDDDASWWSFQGYYIKKGILEWFPNDAMLEPHPTRIDWYRQYRRLWIVKEPQK